MAPMRRGVHAGVRYAKRSDGRRKSGSDGRLVGPLKTVVTGECLVLREIEILGSEKLQDLVTEILRRNQELGAGPFRDLPVHHRGVVPPPTPSTTRIPELKGGKRHTAARSAERVPPNLVPSPVEELEPIADHHPGPSAIGVEPQSMGQSIFRVGGLPSALERLTGQGHQAGKYQSDPVSDEGNEWCRHESSGIFPGSIDPGFYG